MYDENLDCSECKLMKHPPRLGDALHLANMFCDKKTIKKKTHEKTFERK
jgi:hypothetical protein